MGPNIIMSTLQVVLGICLIAVVWGHGYVMDPPGRASAWRFGFNTPTNYDDDQMYCGSYSRHHITNGGKCGICGDPWDVPLPRPHEAGGRYATGTIVKDYKAGQTVDIKVMVTTNHWGTFEFRLCPVNDKNKAATHECLDQHVLQLADGSGTLHYIGSAKGV